MPVDTEEKEPQSEEDFIAQARKRFDEALTDEKNLRDEALADLRFVAGEQWDDKVRQLRIAGGRPALTFNRCHTFVQQVANEARQNKPQIKFIPAEDGDKDLADVYEGLARHIQYDSDAQVAYETAVEYSAGGGFGYYRFLTDYCDDESFDLDLKVVPVLDPFAVYGVLVPACFGIEPTYAFVVEEVPLAKFKVEYPESVISTEGWDEAARQAPGWVGTETVRVAEYWYVKQTKEPLEKGGRKRDVIKKQVKFCKMTGMEKLPGTETDWPGSTIPIIPVLGKQIILKGKPILYSVVRFQRGPQELINYYKTRIAETLGTAPISPFMVAKGQISTPEDRNAWSKMNTELRPFLEYESVDVNGKLAIPPQRQTFEPPIAALSEAAAQEIDDMKATAGIFDASLGNKSNESSGLAIARRQQQSNVTNMHFLDNLERAFKKGGLVMGEVMNVIYDGPRIVRILGDDETPKMVKINQQFQDQNGKAKHYKFGSMEYDLVVTMGRAFSTKRSETFDMMSDLISGNKELLPMIGDIFFRNSDVAGADKLAERFEKMLPPQLQDNQDQPVPPEAQAAIAQKNQELQAMHAYAQQVEQQAQQLQMEKQAKVVEQQGRMAIEQLHSETQIAVAEITSRAQNLRERMKLEFDLNSKLRVQAGDQAHELGMSVMDKQFDHNMGDQQHAQALEQGQAGHEQQLEQASQGHEQALEQQDQAGQQALEQQAAAPQPEPNQ